MEKRRGYKRREKERERDREREREKKRERERVHYLASVRVGFQRASTVHIDVNPLHRDTVLIGVDSRQGRATNLGAEVCSSEKKRVEVRRVLKESEVCSSEKCEIQRVFKRELALECSSERVGSERVWK